MLKRIIVLFLICATVLCSAACGKAPYDIIEKDGKHYISFNTVSQDKAASPNGVNASVYLDLPDFTSIGQMKEKIKNCDFDDKELAAYQYKCEIEGGIDGLWEICDLDSLCDVRMPQGMTLHDISWWGTGYQFELRSQFADSCYVSCRDPEDYNYYYQRYYANCPYEFSLAEEFWEEKSHDPDGTQIFFKAGEGDAKVVKYEIREENRTVYVAELYSLTSYSGTLETSSTVPSRISMFTEEHGALVHITIHNPTERPSVEWLSSFGVTPYEG